MRTYDYIIIGAGSLGLPLAWFLSEAKQRVLVLERLSAPGQGNNKAAIGGVRASHSETVKVKLCRQSIKLYKEWETEGLADFELQKGGYLYIARQQSEMEALKRSSQVIRENGINIELLTSDELQRIVPTIQSSLYLGGMYCPDDINISPLKSAYTFYSRARNNGVDFLFNHEITEFTVMGRRLTEIRCGTEKWSAGHTVLANGSAIRPLGQRLGLDIPVYPDSHEAGISAPYQPLLQTMIVDMSPDEEGESKNFYFIQNRVGAFIFCYTPSQSLYTLGETSHFMPVIARRMIRVMPILKDIYIRRTWRGSYPNTPDGIPIADRAHPCESVWLLGGTCGQGLMLGPGLAQNFSQFLLTGQPLIDPEIFAHLSMQRDFKKDELLK